MTDYSLTVFAAIVPVLGGAGAYPPTTHINAMSYRLAVWAGPLAYTARWHDADCSHCSLFVLVLQCAISMIIYFTSNFLYDTTMNTTCKENNERRVSIHSLATPWQT